MSSYNELDYVKSALGELENYLLSEDLFRTTGRASFPQLTIGNLLLSLRQLEGKAKSRHLTSGEQSDYARLARQVEAERYKWQLAWEKKATHEFISRTSQWANYLNELSKDRDAHAAYYHSEVRVRALLALLAEHAQKTNLPDLMPLDAVLEGMLTVGDFIWEPELEPAFPKEQFWFLYGQIEE